MLTVSRKIDQAIELSGNITIVVNRISGDQVRLSIDAPNEVSINREEVVLDAAEVARRRHARAERRRGRGNVRAAEGGDNNAA